MGTAIKEFFGKMGKRFVEGLKTPSWAWSAFFGIMFGILAFANRAHPTKDAAIEYGTLVVAILLSVLVAQVIRAIYWALLYALTGKAGAIFITVILIGSAILIQSGIDILPTVGKPELAEVNSKFMEILAESGEALSNYLKSLQ